MRNSNQLYCYKCGWQGNKRNIKPITNNRGNTRYLWRCPKCGGKIERNDEKW